MARRPRRIAIQRVMLIPKARRFAVLVLLTMIAGCEHKAQIAGAINTTDYVIPSGDEVTAVGDVTINASRKIEIDGDLYIAPGATVTFKSPSVNIPGRAQNFGMQVGWWRRTEFLFNRIPNAAEGAVNRVLGRTPRYWNREALDCFNPAGRAAALATTSNSPPPSSPRDSKQSPD